MPKVRLNDWTTENRLLTLKDYARQGYTDKEIAKLIGISKGTFYNWIKKSREFEEAIKAGRFPVTVEIEDAFIRECLGYWIEEVTTIEHPNGTKTIKTARKYIRPNVNAQILFLRNRDPKRWSEATTQETHITINHEPTIITYQVNE